MVRKTGILPLFELQDTDTKAAERKYIEILRSYRLENFYFSYTYDLTNSLHWNLSTNAQRLNILGTQPSLSQSESMYGFCEVFQWNYNLLKEFEEVVQMRQWVMPVIHGFCKHMSTWCLSRHSNKRVPVLGGDRVQEIPAPRWDEIPQKRHQSGWICG